MRGLLPTRTISWDPNLDDLMRPSDAFSHPQEIVCDPDLSINEKRAILASWASDACAVEGIPGCRKSPRGVMVTFDDILDALKELDELARRGMNKTPKWRQMRQTMSY